MRTWSGAGNSLVDLKPLEVKPDAYLDSHAESPAPSQQPRDPHSDILYLPRSAPPGEGQSILPASVENRGLDSGTPVFTPGMQGADEGTQESREQGSSLLDEFSAGKSRIRIKNTQSTPSSGPGRQGRMGEPHKETDLQFVIAQSSAPRTRRRSRPSRDDGDQE